MKRYLLILGVLAALTAGCSADALPTLPGDLNGDRRVDLADRDLLEAQIAAGNAESRYDLNQDGQVDEADAQALEGIICAQNGGNLSAAGVCCVTTNDRSICCDPNLDGTFTDCQAPPLGCANVVDCATLSCDAYCGADQKCHCRDMCSANDGCNDLNCPAFCNPNGACECKIACAGNADCLFISKCQSTCKIEPNQVAGYCVCDQICIPEGERYFGDVTARTCCAGFSPLEATTRVDAGCVPPDPVATWVCARCGDATCGPGENPCTCAQDCGECAPGEEKKFVCPDGAYVPWCSCGENRAWDCTASPESQCSSPCHKLGEHFVDSTGSEACCADLTRAADCKPGVDDANQVTCECPKCACFVCVACGDQVCGEAENFCNCPADCPEPACTEGATIACNCGSPLREVPPCWQCDANGQWQPLVYLRDPCLCLATADCKDDFACETGTGTCVSDCRQSSCVNDNCQVCPTNQLCHPDTGLCVTDCRLAAVDPCLDKGLVCSAADGLCLHGTESCYQEGERFSWNGVIEPPPASCCGTLVPVPDLSPDNGHCTGANDTSYVCTFCGTDAGICSSGENRCNCPLDCVGSSGCKVGTCEAVAGLYVIKGDCPGIPSPGGIVASYQIKQGTSCDLTFLDLLKQVLGGEGCIDHAVIATANGCTGAVSVAGCSHTMQFVCPLIGSDQVGQTCSVFLDDLKDCL